MSFSKEDIDLRAAQAPVAVLDQSSMKHARQRQEQLFGHVTLVQSHAVPSGHTGYCLVSLRDEERTVAVFTDAPHMYASMQTGLITGNLVTFVGRKYADPPTPTGGTWAVDVYNPTSFAVYSG